MLTIFDLSFSLMTGLNQMRMIQLQSVGTSAIFGPEALATFVFDAILVLINVGIMFLVLKRFVYQPIFKMLDTRRSKINAEMDVAQKLQTEALSREQEAREKLEKAVDEAVRIVGEAKTRARIESENILKTARLEALDLTERNRIENERLRSRMVHEVRDEVADLAFSIASRVIGNAMNMDTQRQMVNKLLDERLPKIAGQPSSSETESEMGSETQSSYSESET